VEFVHPLIRSAAYRAATVDDRHRVHRALAETTDAEADPDRRAWHRAHATAEPDEDVAAELERSADRAQSRGGLAAAAAFLTRATELTPVPARRVRRAVDAALANVRARGFDIAHTLLAVAREGPVDELQRARIDMVRAQSAFASSRGNEATLPLLASAKRLESLDLPLARQTYLDAFSAAQFVARLDDGVARAARASLRQPSDEPSTGDLLLDAFSALTDDYGTAIPLCRNALRTLRGDVSKERLRWLWQGYVLALELWDDESAYALSHRHLQIARDTGDLSELALALSSRTTVLVFCGDLSGAAAQIAEAQSVQDAAGISSAPYGALMVAAWRGQVREAGELIDVTMREVTSRGEGVSIAISEYSHAVLCNGLGQYEEAPPATRRACAYPREMVEAPHRLAGKARASGTAWVLGMEARARALLSDGNDAERWFHEAIQQPGRARVRAELARAHLLYGNGFDGRTAGWTRAAKLNIAYEMFGAMGTDGFAERARRESGRHRRDGAETCHRHA
jgi:tetratricopeptide (TPR) repeat protein